MTIKRRTVPIEDYERLMKMLEDDSPGRLIMIATLAIAESIKRAHSRGAASKTAVPRRKTARKNKAKARARRTAASTKKRA